MRVARCGVIGLSSGLLAVVAHASATGHLPGLPHVLAFAAAVAWACGPLTDRRLEAAEIVGLVVTVQVTLHVFLAVLGRHPREVVPSPSMLVAHALVTAVVVGALTGAEGAVFRLAAALASVLPRRFTPPPAFAPLRIPIAGPNEQPLSEALRRRTVPRRGPPVL
ncbi:hypothetical protein DFJ66_5899 [Saccharothrix variisporea]|uniref:Uncharacterized protein n=1 Tax=Saccharothrix variisporea TaxID=543527 RepID=A0A495XJG7_9PSEU|nr:hypothetical protein DFJ66_5899 [Saccharothrix variisporea]